MGVICTNMEISEKVLRCQVFLRRRRSSEIWGTPRNEGIPLAQELEVGVKRLGEVMIGICFSIPSSTVLPAYHTKSRIVCFLTASNTHVRKINPLTSPTQCNRKYAPTKKRNSAQTRILCWLKHVY